MRWLHSGRRAAASVCLAPAPNDRSKVSQAGLARSVRSSRLVPAKGAILLSGLFGSISHARHAALFHPPRPYRPHSWRRHDENLFTHFAPPWRSNGLTRTTAASISWRSDGRQAAMRCRGHCPRLYRCRWDQWTVGADKLPADDHGRLKAW